ncbi:hypothetical protein M427DRAFT_264774 [Gonapodya prolifera JEL478]|uniref:Uncharacterized protein n=1 Tax=Gonapodya prolifera (strain JEL478) TaxID=1344416 RepID=A0A139AK75_GONPJ|nr:hypothetical protein M427DRAFT_264774 [Gonapodya prolifera JEL478]|eukprot:KXS17181.1 hypothetical protein M427DRAFT_264774 [Gonapodya prolifera JEL478]
MPRVRDSAPKCALRAGTAGCCRVSVPVKDSADGANCCTYNRSIAEAFFPNARDSARTTCFHHPQYTEPYPPLPSLMPLHSISEGSTSQNSGTHRLIAYPVIILIWGGFPIVASITKNSDAQAAGVRLSPPTDFMLLTSGTLNTLIFFLIDPTAYKLASAMLEAIEITHYKRIGVSRYSKRQHEDYVAPSEWALYVATIGRHVLLGVKKTTARWGADGM